MKRILAIILAAVMVLGLCACGSSGTASGGTAAAGDSAPANSESEKVETRVLKLAMQQVEGSPNYDVALDWLVPQIEERTGGRYTFEVFGGSQLSGGNQLKGIEMCQKGTIDFCIHSNIVLSNIIPTVSAIAIPWLWDNDEQVYSVLTEGTPVYERYKEILAESGLVLLGFPDLGFRELTNNVRPVSTPEDLKGLKMRVLSNNMLNDVFRSWGCNVVYLDGGEIYTGLQQGTIDGQENPLLAHNIPFKMYEVQKYYTVWSYVYDPLVIMCSPDVWNTIPEEDQAIFREVFAEFVQQERKVTQDNFADGMKFIEDYGIEINYLTDEQKEVFKDSIKDVVAPYIESFDPELVKLIYEAVGKTA